MIMAIRCLNCKKDYDVTFFEFGGTVLCECGNIVTLRHEESHDSYGFQREERLIAGIRRAADRISFLIVSTDYPRIDIGIEKEKLREQITTAFPDKAHLYDLIYAPRFRRLEDQFRTSD